MHQNRSLLKINIGKIVAVTLICLGAALGFGQTLGAEDGQPFTIRLSGVLSGPPDNGVFGVHFEFYENTSPVYGPRLSHRADTQTPNHWLTSGYFYEYIRGSRFNCNKEIINQFALLSDGDQIRDWLEAKGLTSEWSLQSSTFKVATPELFWKWGDNNWRAAIDKDPSRRFKDGNSNLAYCIQIGRSDGSNRVINNIVFNFDGLDQSEIGGDITEQIKPAPEPQSPVVGPGPQPDPTTNQSDLRPDPVSNNNQPAANPVPTNPGAVPGSGPRTNTDLSPNIPGGSRDTTEDPGLAVTPEVVAPASANQANADGSEMISQPAAASSPGDQGLDRPNNQEEVGGSGSGLTTVLVVGVGVVLFGIVLLFAHSTLRLFRQQQRQ